MRASFAASFTGLVLISLTACGGGGGGGGGGAIGTPRSFTRDDGAVTVLPSLSGGFTATRVVTVSNDDGAAAAAVVTLLNQIGDITAAPSSSGYQIQVTLRADAPSEQQARDALATMTVVHSDSLGGETLYLTNEVRFAQYSQDNVSRVAAVAASLPPALAYRLFERTGVGSAASSGLDGRYAQLHASTGGVTLSGAWDTALLDSDVGSVTASGDFASLQASSSIGSVTATLSGTRNTQAWLDSSNGDIDVTVTRTLDSGFDLEGTTEVGTVLIVVAGTDPVGTQTGEHGHYRSANYASSTPQVRVVGRTFIGDVTLHE